MIYFLNFYRQSAISCKNLNQLRNERINIYSVGWILLVVYGMQISWTAIPRRRSLITMGIVLLLLLGCYKTVLRNRDWMSRESLIRFVNGSSYETNVQKLLRLEIFTKSNFWMSIILFLKLYFEYFIICILYLCTFKILQINTCSPMKNLSERYLQIFVLY